MDTTRSKRDKPDFFSSRSIRGPHACETGQALSRKEEKEPVEMQNCAQEPLRWLKEATITTN